MARISAKEVADKVQDLLRKNGLDVITLSWPDFYKVIERDRLKVEFIDDLDIKLREHGLMMKAGQAVVQFSKDFLFSPVKIT